MSEPGPYLSRFTIVAFVVAGVVLLAVVCAARNGWFWT